MKIEIITPTSSLYKGEASAVTVPSEQGPFTMLEHHAAIVAILEAGKVIVTGNDGEKQEFDIQGGFCEQHGNTVIICAENGERNGEALNEAKQVKTENGKRKNENE